MSSMLAKRIESKYQYVWTGPFVMFNSQVNLVTIITTKEFLPCNLMALRAQISTFSSRRTVLLKSTEGYLIDHF